MTNYLTINQIPSSTYLIYILIIGFFYPSVYLNAQCSTTTWTAKAPLLENRGEYACHTVNGRLYILGGIFNSSDGPDHVEMYDPISDNWTQRSDMSRPRHHFTGAV